MRRAFATQWHKQAMVGVGARPASPVSVWPARCRVGARPASPTRGMLSGPYPAGSGEGGRARKRSRFDDGEGSGKRAHGLHGGLVASGERRGRLRLRLRVSLRLGLSLGELVLRIGQLLLDGL